MYRSVPGHSRDQAQDRAVALAIAPRYLLSRKLLDASIESAQEVGDRYARAGYRIERREPTLRWTPSVGRARDREAPPNPAAIDPWAQSPETVPGDTRRLTACFSCEGLATLTCAGCRGSTRVSCRTCGGGGRVSGKRGMKNCPSCRAAGTQKCGGCNNGRVPCRPCAASGTVEAWLEIVVSVVTQVKVLGDGPAARVHRALGDYADFDAGYWPNQLLDESRCRGIAPGLEPPLQPHFDGRTERVLDARVQRFGGLASVFTYRTAFGRGTIQVAGNQPTVVSSSELGALGRRRGLTVLALASLVTGAGVTFASYQGRHAWFVQHGNGGWVFLAALAVAVAGTWALSGVLLSAKSRRLARPWVGAVVAAAAFGGTVLAWKSVRPDLPRARSYLAANQPDAASAEAQAVGELGLDVEGAKVVLDETHLYRFDHATGLDAKASIAAQPWYLPAARKAAYDRLLPQLDKEVASSARSASALRSLAKLAAPFDSTRATRWSGEADLLDADAALARNDWEGAVAKVNGASEQLGRDETVETARRVTGALEGEVRRSSASIRTVSDPYARRTKLDSLSKYNRLLGELRSLARVALPADWTAVQTRLSTEAARAEREVQAIEVARQKREAAEAARAAAKRAAEERAAAAARERSSASYASYGGGGGGCRRGYYNKNGRWHCTLH